MTASKQHFDVIVIGGGIIGVSTAWHLTRRGVRRVAVLEKGSQVAAGSTGQSAAVVRQRYTNLPLVQLAYASVEMFRNWTETLEISQNRCGFCPVGVVWITDEPAESHEPAVRLFQQVGAVGNVYAADDLRDRYPSLNFCAHRLDLTGREHDCADPPVVFWEEHGGYADPQGTTDDLLAAGQARGVQLFLRHEVSRIETGPGGRVCAVHCTNGETFGCDVVLNAAGPWCNRINDMLGVTLPMELKPTRVQIALRDRPADVVGDLPVFISLADGLYGRPEAGGRQFIVGSTRPEDEREFIDDPDHYDPDASPEFRRKMMHKLHHRFDMASRGTVQGYAALYTVNTTDWHPIIDAVGPPGYFVANGFSGHGFKLGPCIGGLIARRITGIARPDDPPVDPALFAADRASMAGGGVLA